MVAGSQGLDEVRWRAGLERAGLEESVSGGPGRGQGGSKENSAEVLAA